MAPSAIPITETDAQPRPAKTVNGNEVQTKAKTPLEMISQGTCLPGIPQHPTFAEHRQWTLEKMALAFRVFVSFLLGVLYAVS